MHAVLAPIADRSAMPRRLVDGLGLIARFAPSPLRGWEVPPPLPVPGRIVAGLSPAQFVQPVVVDAEVVGDLVHDGDLHFLDHLLVVVADVQQGVAVDRDGVG